MSRLGIITVSHPVYVLAPRLSFVFCRRGHADIWVLTLSTRAKACFTENESFSRKNGDFSFFPGEEFAKFNKLLILYHFRLIIVSLNINYALIETAIWRMKFFLFYFILPIFFFSQKNVI